jgi:hypothetical protein
LRYSGICFINSSTFGKSGAKSTFKKSGAKLYGKGRNHSGETNPLLKKVQQNPHFFRNFIIFILEGFAPLFLKVER